MTFEPGLLPTRHFLEANTTNSFLQCGRTYDCNKIKSRDVRRPFLGKKQYNKKLVISAAGAATRASVGMEICSSKRREK
jgi:hypothetical protein